MLNEKRLKHMVKLAMYESKGGTEELRISFRHKKDYIGFHTFLAGLWVTIAFIVLVVFLTMTFMGNLFNEIPGKQLIILLVALFGLYLIILFTYTINVRKIYRKKHARAYHRVKKFKDELEELENMYEKEDDSNE